MATQTVEFPCVTGQTVTAKLFSFGSDTQVASVSTTEATNRKGLYSAAFTDVAAGTYRLIALNGSSVPLAAWDVTLTLSTATFQAYEIGMTASSVSSVTGSVGSVAGNVSGSVASIASGGITSSSFATDSITATVLAASAISEIQSGLSTLSAADIRTAVGLASASLDTQLADLPTVAEFEARSIAAANYATAANQVIIIDGIGYTLAQVQGAVASPQTSTPAYSTSFNGSTYTVTHAGVTSTGVRGTAVRSKS